MKTDANTVETISDRWFREIANATYDWEAWHRSDGRLLWVNAAVERMTGYSPAECLSMQDYPMPMVAVKDRQRIADVIRGAIGGSSGNDVEFSVVTKEGVQRSMAVSWQPMLDEVGEGHGFRASVRDVTERHQLQEKLSHYAEHLEQLVQERTARISHLEKHRLAMEKLAALGQLAASVAHEVNNPLAGIRNSFVIFKNNLPPTTPNYELLELIDREIDRISSITHQMYQLYRPSQQVASEFPINRAINDVIRLVETEARKTQVTVQVKPAARNVKVTLPEGEVKQILFNLIRNAVQASEPGAGVVVSVQTNQHELSVIVSDDGCGISAESLSLLFEPFFSTKGHQPGQGMGLGLSVSKSLIEALDGRIEVESQLGEGSRFTAVFPLASGC
ncbi:Sensor protein ZraS [Novipirellula aureliae]|uniref:histidine kinase n=1 Tax=Novipirellula aureliae TaxID=2527966 RepID=A0A5C6EAL6_9BACT|nr:ATP-binding protein [Novipirellula aureliae]TWU45017.1 Sensor protein ZraS [Novipirellula aureliae]